MEDVSLRVAAVCGLLGLVLSLGACNAMPEPVPRPRPVTAGASSLFGHHWQWIDERGQATAFSNYRGVPLVVTEIYTSCTSTCPRTVAELRKLSERLAQKGKPAQFLLVTLDPSSDTPERLRQYKAEQALPVSWHLLSGSERATQELSDVLGIHVMDGGSHLVHDAKIVLFDGHGQRIGLLGASPDNETLAL